MARGKTRKSLVLVGQEHLSLGGVPRAGGLDPRRSAGLGSAVGQEPTATR
jgi:hypothetical protein